MFNVYPDYLNAPREIRNWANQIVWTWYPEASEPFGANAPNQNPAGVGTFVYNLRFPGQLNDPTSGLNYNYYRDYNPRTGRYIESDPLGLDAGSMSTYAYVFENPLGWLDPEGESAEHTSGARPSTQEKHEAGLTRKQRDSGGEKADITSRRPPRQKPSGTKGPWPPRCFVPVIIFDIINEYCNQFLDDPACAIVNPLTCNDCSI